MPPPSVKTGTPQKITVKELIIEITTEFKGKVIFKPIVKLCNIQEYSNATDSLSNIQKETLSYGFDWYRNDWETLIPAEVNPVLMKTTDFLSKVERPGQSATDIIKKYDVSGDIVENGYKLAHQTTGGEEKLIRFTEFISVTGMIEINLSRNEVVSFPSNASLAYYSIQELHLTTGQPIGVQYKSTDTDLTKYNEYTNVFGTYTTCQTMKCLSSIKALKKEYYPVNTYRKTTLGTSIASLNISKQMLKINNIEYFVPWYAGFAKSEDELEIEISIEGNNNAEGEIKIIMPKANEPNFSISGDISIPIALVDSGSKITKKIKIKCNKPVSKDTVLEARFFNKNNKSPKYLGDLVGLLNIFKNSTEYQLTTRYVDVNFRGALSNFPIFRDNVNVVCLDFNRQHIIISKKYNILSPGIPYDIDKTALLGSKNLHLYTNSNLDFLKKGLGQALIKCDVITPNLNLDINLDGDYRLNPISNKGADRIRKTLGFYSDYNNFAISVNDSDMFIKGVIEAYEDTYGELHRGVINFLIPFTIFEPNGNDDYSLFKGRADAVGYEGRYLLLTRSMLEMNAYEVPLHEIGHTLGLHHPFVDFSIKSKHHFVKNETKNVMDYPKNITPLATDFGIYLYKWQWELMQGDVQTATNRGDLTTINIP